MTPFIKNTYKILFLLTVLLLSQSTQAAPSFYLGTDKSFSLKETPYVNLEGAGNRSYTMRIYRVMDPHKFIRSHLDKRLVKEKTVQASGNPFALFRNSVNHFKVSFEKVARKELRGKTRIHIKSSLAVKINPYAKETQLALPDLLPDHEFLYSQIIPESKSNWDYRRIPVALETAGFYLIEVVQGMEVAYTVALKSNLLFLSKQSDNETLVMSAEKDTGSPASGTKIDLYDASNAQHIYTGKTNQSGTVYYQGKTPVKNLLVAEKNGQYALSDPNFYSNSFYGKGGLRSYLYTERPVYRPGDKVYFKGIVRNFNGAAYQISSGAGTVSVSTDNGDTILNNIAVQISPDMGSFNGSFNLPSDDALFRGLYHLNLHFKDANASTEFSVESYKKPEFQVTVKTDKKTYYAKNTIPVRIIARYYHGAPVTGARINYRVFRTPRYDFSPVGTIPYFQESMAYLGYGNNPGKSEIIVEEQGKLDPDGVLTFEIKPKDGNDDYVYNVVAVVSDPSFTLSGSTSFSVNRGLAYLKIQRDNTVYEPGDTAKITARIVPFDSTDNAAAGKIQSNRKVRAVLYSKEFQHISQEKERKKISESSVQTNAQGNAEFSIKIPDRGHFSVSFITEDGDGNEIKAETSLWASAIADSISVPYKNLTLKTGKDLYQTGETAEILIFSPVADGTLFVSLEANKIIKYETIKMKGNVYKYRVKLNHEMTPNFSLSAAVFAAGDVYKSETKIVVPPKESFLQVAVNRDKEVYKPGETVELNLTTKDGNNRPAISEISVSVVDEAIYQIQPEKNPSIISYFYHPRRNNIQTVLSTSYRFFGYSEKSRLNLALLDKKGALLLSMKEEEDVRQNFEDTAFWNATVKTDSNGKAVVRFTLPDNLTTWRIRAIAVTRDTKVGQATDKFIARKDLMINPGLPAFMLRGKKQTVAANITNLTQKPLITSVFAEAENAKIEDLKIDQKVTVAPGRSENVYFSVTPSEDKNIENVSLKIKIQSGTVTDSIVKKIDLRSYGIPESNTLAFHLKNDRAEAVGTFPAIKNSDPVSMRIHLTPGYGEALRQSLAYLADYPYGCIEQTMSRFMPVLAAKKAGFISPRLSKELPEMVQEGLSLIKSHQNPDGGFGWFQANTRQSDPLMTAYVYRGLAVSSALNQAVDKNMLRRTRNYLYSVLRTQSTEAVLKSYILFSLSEGGPVEKSIVAKAEEQAKDADPYVQVLTSLLLNSNGQRTESEKLLNSALKKSDYKKFTNSSYAMNAASPDISHDKTELYSALLLASIRLNQDEKTINQISDALIYNRNGLAWTNSRNTASAVLSLSERMEKFRDSNDQIQLSVKLNGKEIHRINTSPANLHEGNLTAVVAGSEFDPGKNNKITLEKISGPSVFASAIFDYFNNSKSFEAAQKGFRVTRTYSKMKSSSGNGAKKLTGSESSDFSRGDLVMVSLYVERTEKDASYIMIEDPVPPGFSIERKDSQYYSSTLPVEYDSRQIMDDKITFFVTGPKQKFVIRYFLNASLPGLYFSLPAKASLMYFNEIYGTSHDNQLKIQ